ncbi:MAG: hypothetical protein IPN76_12445 [Saprospiraceae bacterium]|nr:hypothetical protein [Saprospiraceae bacterium]
MLNELSKQMLLGKVLAKRKVVLDVFDGMVVFRAPRVEEAVVVSEN